MAKTIPVGRLGRSDDVARAVMFFADPENSFVTGQVLYVCGGASVAASAFSHIQERPWTRSASGIKAMSTKSTAGFTGTGCGAISPTIVDPGTTVEIHGITPHDNYAHPIVEFRCAREVICNAVKAEREGYDAFIIGHFQDAGLYEARSVVDIPVVALGEASMLHACQLGQRTGIVTINPRYISWFHHQISKYGLERRVTGVHAMTFEPGQILKAYESEALAADVVRLFAEQARPLVAGRLRRADPRRRHSDAAVRRGHAATTSPARR